MHSQLDDPRKPIVSDPSNLETVLPSPEELSQSPQTQQAQRPQGLPDKFWDAEKNQPRVGSLWRSYQALEQRFSRGEDVVPPSHEDYCLECGEHTPDPEVNAVLHRAGFTNTQAQVVYDLARHYVVPKLQDTEKSIEAATVRGRLEEYFGGKERWNTVSRQLSDWGRTHLPADVMEAMSSSFEGIQALYRMMAADEPGISNCIDGKADDLDEKKLKQLMAEPGYWRDQDPALVAKVRAGFERLYPS